MRNAHIVLTALMASLRLVGFVSASSENFQHCKLIWTRVSYSKVTQNWG
jgi:hypothetical protein